jgi:enamine deaminase RidA (YjgF/YER057c/UK114 family)
MDYSDVVSVQPFLTDMTQFKRMNAVYASVFKTLRLAHVPVGVSELAVPTAHLEITAIAQRQGARN